MVLEFCERNFDFYFVILMIDTGTSKICKSEYKGECASEKKICQPCNIDVSNK